MDYDNPSSHYDSYYYANCCGQPYEHNEVWLSFFGTIAERIIQDMQPRTVLDSGCAMGFLVESLRQRGTEAWGVDISEYAIQNVQPGIRPYCWVGSVLDPLPRRYDVIVSIETLEHLIPHDSEQAVQNICQYTDEVLFSSTPFDLKEATHFNVQPPEYWAELFADNNFFRDLDYDATYITPWAMRFRKSHLSLSNLVSRYEQRLWRLAQENNALRELNLELRAGPSAKESQTQAPITQIDDHDQVIQAGNSEIEEQPHGLEPNKQAIQTNTEPPRNRLDRWALSIMHGADLWRREGFAAFRQRLKEKISAHDESQG